MSIMSTDTPVAVNPVPDTPVPPKGEGWYTYTDEWGWRGAGRHATGNLGFSTYAEALADANDNHGYPEEAILIGRVAKSHDDNKLVLDSATIVWLRVAHDPELDAIRTIVATLYPFDEITRQRIAEYIAARFG